jgi:hypothetical protein
MREQLANLMVRIDKMKSTTEKKLSRKLYLIMSTQKPKQIIPQKLKYTSTERIVVCRVLVSRIVVHVMLMSRQTLACQSQKNAVLLGKYNVYTTNNNKDNLIMI